MSKLLRATNHRILRTYKEKYFCPFFAGSNLKFVMKTRSTHPLLRVISNVESSVLSLSKLFTTRTEIQARMLDLIVLIPVLFLFITRPKDSGGIAMSVASVRRPFVNIFVSAQ